MDLTFYGGNCLVINTKSNRLVFDDELKELGQKSIIKDSDIVVYTSESHPVQPDSKILIDSPGEYEIANISIRGLAARSHMDESNKKTVTMYVCDIEDMRFLVTGHIYPELSDSQLEKIGTVDVLVIPVGGNGYTLDAIGAQKIIKDVEPKIVIPTHYADTELKYQIPQQAVSDFIKQLGMETKETTDKLKLKPSDLTDTTQVIVLQKTKR